MEQGLLKISRCLEEPLTVQMEQPHPVNASSMHKLEQQARAAALQRADLISARAITRAHLDPGLCSKARQDARNRALTDGRGRLRAKGNRPVSIRLRNGTTLNIKTPYLRPKKGKGVYPVLESLGLTDQATPALREVCARQLVLSDSIEEAQLMLALDGVRIHSSTLVFLAVYLGQRALELQNAALDAAIEGPLPKTSPLKGRRIQVSIDGGRARTRKTDTSAPVGENGRRPFECPWREPRIITLTVLDKHGRQDKKVRPVYLVSLGEADDVMRQVVGLLRYLGAHLAKRVVFVCDGANWLWERIEQVVSEAGLKREQVVYVLDFWHACEYIHKALLVCKNIKSDARDALYCELRRLLRDETDGAEQVLARLRPLARGRRAALINKRVRYLDRHIEHMRYATVRRQALPIGSGVVESAVRRVVNLRFKSASMFWRADHLEPLLALRALLKSGRWEDFIRAEQRGQFWLPRAEEERKEEMIAKVKAA